MARLSETEKAQLLQATAVRKPTPQPVRRLSPKEYLQFVTWASRFGRKKEAPRFEGQHWKL
jgi:hypothetical protein